MIAPIQQAIDASEAKFAADGKYQPNADIGFGILLRIDTYVSPKNIGSGHILTLIRGGKVIYRQQSGPESFRALALSSNDDKALTQTYNASQLVEAAMPSLSDADKSTVQNFFAGIKTLTDKGMNKEAAALISAMSFPDSLKSLQSGVISALTT